MADIFRQVDDDLRRERYEKLWKRYGRYVIAAAVVVVLVVAGTQAWREYRESAREADSEQFNLAMSLAQAGRSAEAINAFAALAADAGSGYAVLARLREAALRAESGDRAGALAVYNGLATDGSADALYRDLAVVLYALNDLDGDDPTALLARLAPLTEGGNPWRFSARELTRCWPCAWARRMRHA